jgi:spermidine synthase
VCAIDPLVTEATKAFMPFMWAGVGGDGRGTVRHEDAVAFLARAEPGSFDVVISDITDPSEDSPASQHLYSEAYFRLIERSLARGGVCVAQAQELSIREHAHHRSLRELVGRVFPAVHSAQVYVPSFGYPEGFVFACAVPLRWTRDEVERALADDGLAGDGYFDAAVHDAMFALPPIVARRLTTRDA